MGEDVLISKCYSTLVPRFNPSPIELHEAVHYDEEYQGPKFTKKKK